MLCMSVIGGFVGILGGRYWRKVRYSFLMVILSVYEVGVCV